MLTIVITWKQGEKVSQAFKINQSCDIKMKNNNMEQEPFLIEKRLVKSSEINKTY